MNIIQDLNLMELKEVIAWLREYKQVKKRLWKRGIIAFHKNLSGEEDFVVEYSKGLNEDDIYKKALEVYEKVFSESPKKEEINLKVQEKLSWGMRIYKDDFMLDLSFNYIEKKLKK